MPESHMPLIARAFRNAAIADPTNVLSWYYRAHISRDQGDIDGWRRAIDVALTMPHDTMEQLYCRGWSKIMLDDWSGWSDYGVRFFMPDEWSPYSRIADWIKWTRREWDGIEDLSDKTIAILPEQGLGDNIQMLRFIPVLAERAKHVVA